MKKGIFGLFISSLLFLSGCGSNNSRQQFHGKDDLSHARIGVMMGSTQDLYAAEHFPEATVVRLDTEPDVFVALDTKKVDAIVLDGTTYAINHANSDKYVLLDTVFRENFGIGFSYNSLDLRNQFNAFLAGMRADGSYDKLMSYWFDDYHNARMPEWEDVPSGKPIKVGITGSSEGFAFILNGKPAGFDVDLLERFGRSVGRPTEFSYINFGGLIAALSSGTVDIITSGMTITEERSRQVAFSDPYYQSVSVAVVRTENYADGHAKNGKKKLKSIDDAADQTVAVVMGNLHDSWMASHYPDARVLRFDGYPDVLMSLESGNSDIAMVEGIMYETSLKQKGLYEQLGVLFDDPYGVGFRLDNTALRDQFNVFLKEIRSNGVYDEMKSRWIDQYATAKMPVWTDKPTGKPLRYGCTGTSDTFDFMQDGQHAGFDVEMIERFGRSIGRPIEYFTLNFGGLIAALGSGTVDMIASAMTINEERSKQVAFSDPYFISQSLAIVLKKRYDYGTASAPGRQNSGWRTVDDLKNRRFGVLMSSVQDEYIIEHYPEAEVIRIDLTPDLIMSLKSGQCDAIVLPLPQAKEAMKTDNTLGILDDESFKVEFGIGFRDSIMRDRFNDYLAEIRKNGIYNEMEERWIVNTDNASMPALAFPENAQPIRIGTTAQSAPFSFIKNGKNSGFDIELVSRFAEQEGCPVTFETMSFGGLIPALVSGKIDILANSAMMTPERRNQVAFSDPYYTVNSAVMVLRENLAVTPSGMKDGSDLATASVGAMTGTTGEMFIEGQYPDARLSLFDDITDAIAALRTGKVDYVITAYTTALLASKRNDDLRLLPEKYINEPSAVALKKDNTQLAEKINGVLREMKRDGRMAAIVERWIERDGEGYTGVENPAGPDAPVLRTAVAANREPIAFVRNNKIVGLDCEMIETVAAELGMRVEYQDMKFSALINALESGRADVVVSNFSATEERRKKVLFSDDYFTNPQILMTLAATDDSAETVRPGFLSRIKESFYNNLVLEKRWKLIVEGLKATLIITFFATILGTLIGGLICAMRMSRRRLMNGFAKFYINIMRGTPLLVLLMIFFYVIFASTGMTATVVAIITFALNMAAYSSEMFRTSIEGVDPGQKEAGIAMGFTKLQTFIYIILPQAVRKVIPIYKGEVISLLKMTSIVGYIAVVDLTKASDIIRSRTFDAFFPLIVVAVIYFILAWLIGLGLDYLNKKVSSAK